MALGREEVRSLIYRIAGEEKFDARLTEAVARAESELGKVMVSPKGAVGIMQMMPDTAKDYGITDRCDPEQSIRGGIRFLKDLMAEFDNNVMLALGAYNAGRTRIYDHRGVPVWNETAKYVVKSEFLAGLRLETWPEARPPGFSSSSGSGGGTGGPDLGEGAGPLGGWACHQCGDQVMKARVAVAAVAVALGAVALLAVDPAWAQSAGGGSLKPVEGVFDFLVKFLQGPFARSAAIIAVGARGTWPSPAGSRGCSAWPL